MINQLFRLLINMFEKPGPKKKKTKGKKLPLVREVPDVSGIPCVLCGNPNTMWCHMSSDEKFNFGGGGMGDKISDRIGAILCLKCHQEMDTPPDKEYAKDHSLKWYRIVIKSWEIIWERQ